jgi:RNA polymerase sigma factor (sigma-70 family)
VTSPARSPAFEASFERHRRAIWGLCYRLTGSAADADDLVQDTFTRALERPPADRERDLRPWLLRVATNLGRDLLRARKRRAYVGPWLPTPVALGPDGLAPGAPSDFAAASPDAEPHMGGAGARYELLESVSFAFLVALEALTPKQRAVLLLRDVFDYSGRECAAALHMTEGGVKTTLHRARHAMEDYEAARCQQPQAATERALTAFVSAIASNDVQAVEGLLAEQVRALSDGGDEFFAAKVPVDGRAKVAKFFLKIAQARGAVLQVELRELNGQPALLAQFTQRDDKDAPKVVTLAELDANGAIARLYSVLTTDKVGGLFREDPTQHQRTQSTGSGSVPSVTT